jgi:hypothetical protein
VEKAISKIKQTIAWRKEFEVDQIRHAFDSNGMVSNKSGLDYRSIIMKENETGKIYVRGYDKNGRAILILRPGKENSKLGFDELNQMRHLGMSETVHGYFYQCIHSKLFELQCSLVYFLERAIACTREKSQQEKFIVLVDYTGFSPFLHAPPMSTTKVSSSFCLRWGEWVVFNLTIDNLFLCLLCLAFDFHFTGSLPRAHVSSVCL